MNGRITIPVMHCFDNNYVIPAAVSFYTMLLHANPQYDYALYVLHSDITVQNQEKLTKLVMTYPNATLTFIDMSHRFDDLWTDITNTDHLTKEVLYKLVLSKIFPQYDTMIITDVDVVFLGDIAPSYSALDTAPDAYFAGVHQINPDRTFLRDYYQNYRKVFGEDGYRQLKVCGGYLVANLKKQRADGIEKAFLEYLKMDAARLFQAEQDVINFCCKSSQIAYLPLNYVTCNYMYDIFSNDGMCCMDPHYSFCEIKDAMEHPIQLHYAMKGKPWNGQKCTKGETWFDYLRQTEFYDDFTKIRQQEAEGLPKRLFPGKEKFCAKKDEDTKIKVSVVCCTYNHEKFIDRALAGILEQNTKFPFEVIVADDGSTDGTQNIIQKWQEKYPEQMKKCIFRKVNIGIGQNYFEALSLAEGKYLALCDGDDYWIDPDKLQMEADFLDKHEEYSMVCTDFMQHWMDGSCKESVFDVKAYLEQSGKRNSKLTVEDLVFCRFIASCTVMMRWVLHGSVPEFLRSYSVIDFPLILIHASCGYTHVITKSTAVYNIHSASVTNAEHENVVKQTMDLLREVNQFCDFELTTFLNAYSKQVNKAADKERQLTGTNTDTILQCVFRRGKRLGIGLYRSVVPLKIRNRLSVHIHRW